MSKESKLATLILVVFAYVMYGITFAAELPMPWSVFVQGSAVAIIVAVFWWVFRELLKP